MGQEDKIACFTPTDGRSGATNIPRWKYECIRRAILNVLNESSDPVTARSCSSI